MNKKKNLIFIFSIILLILFFILSLLLGSEHISLKQFIYAFTQKDSFYHTIIFNLRLPRSILVCLSGMLLACSAASFQMFYRNPLAEPGIIGLTSGATLGAVIAQVLPITFSVLTISVTNLFAFFGALIAGIIIIAISKQAYKKGTITLLLAGCALGTFYSAISSIILLTKTKELHGIYTWILGSFNGKSWQEVKIITIPSIIALFVLLKISKDLNLLISGTKSAKSLGLDTDKLQTVLLIATSLAVSSSVCAGGTINFIGLIAPHIVRKILGNEAKTLIKYSAIYGAILLLISDTISRTVIAPSELPTGLITSLFGVPFFICLIFSKSNYGNINE